MQAVASVLLVGVIAGLVVWINQATVADQWRYWTVTWPYVRAQVRPYVLSAAKELALKPRDSFKECAQDCPEMIVVPAGAFTMGSSTTEQGRYYNTEWSAHGRYNNNEGPQHKVTITNRFAVSKYDVTFADWDACVSVDACPKAADSGFGRDTKPVMYVSWDDAQTYVGWLSKMTGKPYRLLTEAEWEYAARAGTTTAYYWGDEIGKGNANCRGCDSQWDAKPSPVGSFAANQFGLYDMAGNVFQWVQDCYHTDYKEAPTDGSAWTSGDCSNRVGRGGSWVNVPQDLRSALRLRGAADNRLIGLGFRVGRTLVTP